MNTTCEDEEEREGTSSAIDPSHPLSLERDRRTAPRPDSFLNPNQLKSSNRGTRLTDDQRRSPVRSLDSKPSDTVNDVALDGSPHGGTLVLRDGCTTPPPIQDKTDISIYNLT